MKKFVAILIAVLLIASCVTVLAACKKKDAIEIWVGSESATFYQKIADEYIDKYKEDTGKKFPYEIKVSGVDTSASAETVLEDPDSAPDIFTVAHDNLGKLWGDNPVISTIVDPELIAQIENDNPQGFIDVVKNTDKNGNEVYVAVPYIGQALVLFYDKSALTEEQVKSWDTIWQVARQKNVPSTFPMGNDCYNLSFLTLARKIDARDANGNPTQTSTTVKIYEGADNADRVNNGCYFQGDDTMAVFKWGQRFFTKNAHGGELQSADIVPTVQNTHVLSLIGGAWKFQDAKAAWGDNLGVAELPEFTIQDDDAYGTITAGTVFKSGTFADCKCFCMNGLGDEKKYEYLPGIIKYFTSKEVQERSFNECQNLPAYKNASEEFEGMQGDSIEAQLAQKQIDMMSYGIPQPFGYHELFNNYFYSRGTDALIQDILLKRDSANNGAVAYNTDELLLAGLQRVEYVWKNGKQPA